MYSTNYSRTGNANTPHTAAHPKGNQPHMNIKFMLKPIPERGKEGSIKIAPKAPKRASYGAAAWDIANPTDVAIPPGETYPINTGVHPIIPTGYALLVLERSSLHKKGLSLANKVGLIDSDYRGAIHIALRNTTDKPVMIDRGERLAQLLPIAVPSTEMVEITEEEHAKDRTVRGAGGFGSTGTH